MDDRRPTTPVPDGPEKNTNQRRRNSRDRANINQQDKCANTDVSGGDNSHRGGHNSSRDHSNPRVGHDRNNSDQGRGATQELQNPHKGGNEPVRSVHNNTHAPMSDNSRRGDNIPREGHGYQSDLESDRDNAYARGSHIPGVKRADNKQRQRHEYHSYMKSDCNNARESHNPQGAGYDSNQSHEYQQNMGSGFQQGGGPFQPAPGGLQTGPYWAPYGMTPYNPGYNAMGSEHPPDYCRPLTGGPEYPMYPNHQQPDARYPSNPAGFGLLPTPAPSPFPLSPPPIYGMFGQGNVIQTPTNRGGYRDGRRGNQRSMPANPAGDGQQPFENQPLDLASSNLRINNIQTEPGCNRGQRSNSGARRNYDDRSNEHGRHLPNDQRSINDINRNDNIHNVSRSENGARPKTYSARSERTNENKQKGTSSDRNGYPNEARLNNTSARRNKTSFEKSDQDDVTISKNKYGKEDKNQHRYRTFEGENTRARGRGMRVDRERSGFRRRGGRGPRRGSVYGKGGGYIGIRKDPVDDTSHTDSDLESCYSDVSSVVNDADRHDVLKERISDIINSFERGEMSRRSNTDRGNLNSGGQWVRGRELNKRDNESHRNSNDDNNESSSMVCPEDDDDITGRDNIKGGPERKEMYKMYRGRFRDRGRGRFIPRKRYVGNGRKDSVERSELDNEEDTESRNDVDTEGASGDDYYQVDVTELDSNVKAKRGRSRNKTNERNQDDVEKLESDLKETEAQNMNESSDDETPNVHVEPKTNMDNIATLPLKTLQNRLRKYKPKLRERQKQGAGQTEVQNRMKQIKAIEKEIVGRKISESKIERRKTSDTNEDKDNANGSETVSCKQINLPRRVKFSRTGGGKISYDRKPGNKILKVANIVADDVHDASHAETKAKKYSVPDIESESQTFNNKPERKKSTENNKPSANNSDIMLKKPDYLKNLLSTLDEVIKHASEQPANKKMNIMKEKDEIKNETSYGSVKNPIATDVFAFMVKNMGGFGGPNEIKHKSRMFETEFNVESYFDAITNFFVTLKRGYRVTHVFACMPKMSYCYDYLQAEGCTNTACNKYHVCMDMVCGYCRFGNKCKHSHDFLDEWNGQITKELGLAGKFSNHEIATILACRQPHVCEDWAVDQGCTNEYCPKLHVCPRFIIGNCLETDSCPLGHDFKSQHNKPIMTAYGLVNWNTFLVRKLVYVTKNMTVKRHVVKELSKVAVLVAKEEASEWKEEPMNIETFPEEAVLTDRTFYERDGVLKESVQTGHNRLLTMDEACSKNLCVEYIHGNCYQGNCTRLHNDEPLPYLWQVKLFGDWVTLPDSESVERHFCTPGKRSHSCIVNSAEQSMSCTVAFRQEISGSISDLRGHQKTGQEISGSISDLHGHQKTETRRLTTVSFKEAGDVADSYVTQWRWYWRDKDRQWELVEPDSLQHTLEAKFLAKQPTYLYSRENYKSKYEIDFNSMTQRNLDTGAVRKLRRRPLFVSYRDVQENKTPPCLAPPQAIDVELPPSWVPWDVAHPFELVHLSHTDTEFIEVSNNFYKTMSRHRHILAAVFRIQNHALLSAFCTHEKTMLNNQRRLGDSNPVDKRNLFHGTDSPDTVRGICINNLDFRLCGKNATSYGHGSYFATDARYSHKYTKPSKQLDRFMFQAKVLVGYYTKGKHEYKRPPGKPGKDHELYDSCVDKEEDPSIFILFEKNAYYPEYLIQYNCPKDRDILFAMNPAMLRRYVHSSHSFSSISSSVVNQTLLTTATPTPAAAASQQSYAAPQSVVYTSTTSTSADAPPVKPTRTAFPPSPPFSVQTNTGSSGYTSPTRTSSTNDRRESPTGASWNQPAFTIDQPLKQDNSCSIQ